MDFEAFFSSTIPTVVSGEIAESLQEKFEGDKALLWRIIFKSYPFTCSHFASIFTILHLKQPFT